MCYGEGPVAELMLVPPNGHKPTHANNDFESKGSRFSHSTTRPVLIRSRASKDGIFHLAAIGGMAVNNERIEMLLRR